MLCSARARNANAAEQTWATTEGKCDAPMPITVVTAAYEKVFPKLHAAAMNRMSALFEDTDEALLKNDCCGGRK